MDGRLAAYEQWFPAEARVLRWHLERARLLLDDIDLDRARRVVLHSDFALWNLLYEDETLPGVLDFGDDPSQLPRGRVRLVVARPGRPRRDGCAGRSAACSSDPR